MRIYKNLARSFFVLFIGFAFLFTSCSDDVSGPDSNEEDVVTEYTISTTSNEGGSISPNGSITVEEGDDQTFNISASSGYVIQDVLVDGSSVGVVESYTFENVQSDHTIEALFEQEPDLPETTPVQVDLSYFDESNAGTDAEYQPFNTASNYAGMANTTLQSYMSFGQIYFEMSTNEDTAYEDGMWVWEYTYESITIRITAEDIGEGIEWNMYLDGTDPETGENWDNQRLMSGYTTHDDGYGEWSYYSADPGVTEPILYYEWEFSSESDYWMELTITDDETGEVGILTYVKDGADNTIDFVDLLQDNSTMIVYWNTDSNTGYMEEVGVEKVCWNDSYVSTSCTELGY